jgi:hypothetical protein
MSDKIRDDRPHITVTKAYAAYKKLWNARKRREEYKPAPSYAELGRALGISTQTASDWVNKLVARGKVLKLGNGLHRATMPAPD